MREVNPSMLMIARESRGLTQGELALSIGMQQGTISKLESGFLPASTEHAQKYAEQLSYPVDLFFQKASFRELPVTFYRKKAKTTKTATDRLRAMTTIRRLHLQKLIERAELPDLSLPLVNLSEHQGNVEGVARELRIGWHVPPGPITNLTNLLEDKGIVVVRCDFGANDVDGFSIFEKGEKLPPLIVVSNTLPGDRLRFTLAHELGHIILHSHQLIPTQECETEANRFASEFLLPTAEIKGYLNAVTMNRLMDLKQFWRVSMGALLQKAKSLETVTSYQHQRLWREMSQLGYRAKEPIELPVEEPSLLNELARFHVEELGLSSQSVCDLLCLHPQEAQAMYSFAKPTLRVVPGGKGLALVRTG